MLINKSPWHLKLFTHKMPSYIMLIRKAVIHLNLFFTPSCAATVRSACSPAVRLRSAPPPRPPSSRPTKTTARTPSPSSTTTRTSEAPQSHRRPPVGCLAILQRKKYYDYQNCFVELKSLLLIDQLFWRVLNKARMPWLCILMKKKLIIIITC